MEKKDLSRFGMLLVLFFCLCMSVYSQEPDPTEPDPDTWSLEDLYDRALVRSRQIQIGEETLYINRKDKNRAVAALIPDLDAFGNYTVNDERTTQSPDSSTAYGVKLSQSFTLNGRELVAFKMAKHGIVKAEQDLASIKEDYLFLVASAYYQVLKARETRKATRADVDRLSAHKEAVKLKLRLEAVPKTQLYRTDAELSGSKTRLVIAENDLRVSRLKLADLVDLPENFTLTAPELSETVAFEPGELVRTALLDRPDLKALRTAQTIAHDNIRLSRGSFWPYLSLEGTYSRQDIDPSSYMPMDPETSEIDEDSFSASAGVVFPLFEGGLRRSELSQAKAREKQAGLRVEEYEKQVALEVRQSYLDMIAAKSAITSVKDQVTSARKNYDAISRRFKTGLADSLDVMDANTLLTQSERDLVEAKYSYALAILKLKRDSGISLLSAENKTEKQ